MPCASNRSRKETRDTELPLTGAQKRDRINLGLELLCLAAEPGETFLLQEIAAWCGCTYDAVSCMERAALRKIRRRLSAGDGKALARELAA